MSVAGSRKAAAIAEPGATDRERLRPQGEAEAAEMVRSARAEGRTLAVEGSGTRPIGEAVEADAVLSGAALAGIVDYVPTEMVVIARPGTPVAALKDALAAEGQMLAFEPVDHCRLLGTEGTPTIGGMVGANGHGSRRFVAGGVRDAMLGLRFVDGRGETVKNGGRVMKNVTGLDLVKPMAGSYGTLGFFTELTFKVKPVPETASTLVLRGLLDAEAVTAMSHALASSCEVSGAAHLPELVAAGVLDGALGREPATLLRLEGFEESVRMRGERLETLLRGVGEIDWLEAGRTAALWQEVSEAAPFAADPAKPLWRLSMKPSDGHEAVMALRRQGAWSAFYDWQGGLVWLQAEHGMADAHRVRQAISDHGGGHATLLRAPTGRGGAPIFQPLPLALGEMNRRVRKSLDPDGLFNPGRMGS